MQIVKVGALLPLALLLALFCVHSASAQANPPKSVFGEPRLITDTMDGAHNVAAADLDGDGDQDVVAVARDDGRVRWFRNDGGDLGAVNWTPFDVDILGGVYAVTVGDLNNDGAPDFAAVGVGVVEPSVSAADARGAPIGELVWYENNGHSPPTFTRRLVINTLNYPVAVHAADLDGDGDADLLSASRDDNRVMWYENNGDSPPTFTPHLLTEQFSGAVSVHAGDLNGDGRTDVAFAAENTDTIGWLANQGGTPAQFALNVIRTLPGELPPLVDHAKGVYIADLEPDGDNDIAFVSESQKIVGWYENNGGAAPSFTEHLISLDADHAKTVRAGDIDFDGDADLLVAMTGDGGALLLFENQGGRPPQFERRDLLTDFPGARSAEMRDLNGDGQPDVLATSRNDNEVRWLPNQSIHQTLSLPADTRTALARGSVGAVVSGDINRDGRQDLAAVVDGALRWYAGSGLTPPALTPQLIQAQADGQSVAAAGDLDGNGTMDLLTVGPAVTWYAQSADAPPTWTAHVLTDDAAGAHAARMVDWDRDGRQDVVAAVGDRLLWLRQTGGSESSFAPIPLVSDQPMARLAMADFNRDGMPDIGAVCRGCDQVTMILNGGRTDPALVQRFAFDVPAPHAVAAADVDRNGRPDLIIGTDAGIRWIADPAGEGAAVQMLAATPAPVTDLQAADLDHDGDMDFAGTMAARDTLFYLEQTSPQVFVLRTVSDLAMGAHRLALADLDGDGDREMVVGAEDEDALLWFDARGGHYRVDATAAPYASVTPGRMDDWLTLQIEHLGRPGAADLLLHSLELRLTDADGNPVDASGAGAVLEEVAVYRDACCDSTFHPDKDSLLARLRPPSPDQDGVMTIAFTGDPAARLVKHGPTATLFIAGILEGTCSDRPAPHKLTASLTAGSVSDSRDDALTIPLGFEGGRLAVNERSRLRLEFNELMADNRTLFEDPEQAGSYPAWVELRNGRATAVDLGGYALSSDPANPDMALIPADLTLEPGRHLLVISHPAATEPRLVENVTGPGQILYVNVPLAAEGGFLALYGPAPERQPIASVRYPAQEPDQVWGRYPVGSATWQRLEQATPGAANQLLADVDQPMRLFLPEIRLGVAYVDACGE